jgi:hypothetical protein
MSVILRLDSASVGRDSLDEHVTAARFGQLIDFSFCVLFTG